MALYETFGQLLSNLRAEAKLSANPASSSSADTRYKTILNRVYASLYRSYEWPHLRYTAPRIPLLAGDRFYDFPDAINPEKLQCVTAWLDSTEYPLALGIGSREYGVHDSVSGARRSPPERYSAQATAPNVYQIEIWPVPESNGYSLEVTGIRKCPKLVNSGDLCLLDGDVVVLFAAADILATVDKAAAEAKLSAARQLLPDVRSGSVLPDATHTSATRIGLGQVSVRAENGHAVVRVR